MAIGIERTRLLTSSFFSQCFLSGGFYFSKAFIFFLLFCFLALVLIPFCFSLVLSGRLNLNASCKTQKGFQFIGVHSSMKPIKAMLTSLHLSPTFSPPSLFLSTSLWHSLFLFASPLLVLGQVQGALATGCQLHDAVAEAYTHQGCQATAGRQCTTHKAQANGKLTHPPRPHCNRPGALENPISHQLYRIVQKCLNTLDLTSLGIGSCCGTGMYLVAGMVAQRMAGPGVVISFIIAAIASIFSGKSQLNLSIFLLQNGMGNRSGNKGLGRMGLHLHEYLNLSQQSF